MGCYTNKKARFHDIDFWLQSLYNTRNNKNMDQKKIESLLSVDLIKELGLDWLPDEERQKILDEMSELVSRAIWLKIMDNLNETQAEALGALIDTATDHAEVTNFLKQNIPSIEEIIREEVARYKGMMMPAHLS